MIVNPKRGLLFLIQTSFKPLLILFIWDMLVVIGYKIFNLHWFDQSALPTALIGSVLVLFMNFRNNTAYNRWWEARIHWGSVTNNCRSFARQCMSILDSKPELIYAMAGYAYSLSYHLRNKNSLTSYNVKKILPHSIQTYIKNQRNQPNGILVQIGYMVTQESRQKNIDGALHSQIDRILSDLANAQGALERIKNTPLSIQFSTLPRLLSEVICIILPFSMVDTLGWITPLGSALVGFLFLALDRIGNDLQDPFDESPHSLPMLTMSRSIEIDLLEQINQSSQRPIPSINGIQW
ncbi:hypothetical protein GN303_03145 [Commensalibacter melissae]|uniref:Bestrophin n=1 Tax=Commensalibacter melissae TaxID=2070537 RepID=A0A318N2B3_9PROT|nr:MULTISPECIES: bestrophin family ion channel [Commensalibacter]MCT6896155.1 hypothetical protein [Commensalibacter sp.]MBI0074979.1 hypothetical protein [Commensalibacter sp. M0357]MBI0084821.1 hypothetical protein [Commensalibacter sp. M0355]MUG80891.1 hypothetical protein [Commensalibacter melissae]PXZ00645.1 hypothetical protein DK869_04375 [Commensalibacter melissae]